MGLEVLVATTLFAASPRPVALIRPEEPCRHGAQVYGGGVRRLDPGTVNLPLWVGTCPFCPAAPKPIVFWFKLPTPKKTS